MYLVLLFFFFFKKRPLKCIKWSEHDGGIKVNASSHGNNSAFNINSRVKSENDFIASLWLAQQFRQHSDKYKYVKCEAIFLCNFNYS